MHQRKFMRKWFALPITALASVFLLIDCNNKKTEDTANKSEDTVAAQKDFNGFESQAKWGEHLVTVGACHDCHSPKKNDTQRA